MLVKFIISQLILLNFPLTIMFGWRVLSSVNAGGIKFLWDKYNE
jgi:hypothetical protein